MTTGARAIQYAEGTLGVHAIFEATQQHEDNLRQARERLLELKRYKADEEEQYADAELAFYSDQRAQHADMSQAAFDKHIKVEINRDPDLRRLRGQLATRQRQTEAAEYDIAVFRTRVEVGIARMNELGGYFAYLASVKNAETARQYGSTNWPSDAAVAAATTPPTT